MRSIALLALSALVALPGIARAAEPVCLTPGEFTALSTYSLPSLIRGTVERCGPVLPSSAFLRSDGERLAQRYATNRDKAWPGAKAAFMKVGMARSPEAAQIFGQMKDDTLKPMVDELVIGMVSQQLPEDRCKPVDRALMLLAPLPAENTAELIGVIAGLGARSGKAKVGQISLCEA
jgi:hypothetical protein